MDSKTYKIVAVITIPESDIRNGFDLEADKQQVQILNGIKSMLPKNDNPMHYKITFNVQQV